MVYRSGSLNFCFKGNRDYVHGTDMYNEINKFIMNELKLDNITNIDTFIHRIVRNNLDLEIYKNEDVNRKDDTAVVFCFTHNFDRYKLLLSENDRKIDCRYKYPEEGIIEKCKLDIENKKIILDSETRFTDIEVFIAMNKALVKGLYPEVKGKWWYVRMQTDRYEKKSKYDYILLELKHNFNFKLTKSLIKIDDKERGFIYFSLI